MWAINYKKTVHNIITNDVIICPKESKFSCITYTYDVVITEIGKHRIASRIIL